MTLIELIGEATKEFEQNGRSEKFVKMENSVVNKGNPLQIYRFARYTKGADIKKLQKAMWDKATLEECFYFAYYVKGVKKDENGVEHIVSVDLVPFATRAIHEGNAFWIEKFAKLVKQRLFDLEELLNKTKDADKIEQINKEYDKLATIIVPLMEEYSNIDFSSLKTGKDEFDIDKEIDKAKKEVEQNGYSTKFKQVELQMKYRLGTGDFRAILFVIELEDFIKMKEFEKAIEFSGEYYNIYYSAVRSNKINKINMLKALRFTKLDYVRDAEDRIILKNRAIAYGRNANSVEDEEFANSYQSNVDNCIAELSYRTTNGSAKRY